MTEPLRLGVVGAGRVFTRLYAPALARVKGVRLAAVAEPDEERRAAACLSGVLSFESLDDLLAAEAVEAVAILSPPRLHVAQMRAAIERGLPVLVEKPVALSIAELAPLPGFGPPSLLTPAFPRRWWPFYRRLRDRARHATSLRLVLETDPGAWGASAEPTPGPEHDLLPHLVDLARWLTGAEVLAAQAVADTTIDVVLHLAGGRQVSCRAAHGGTYREWVEIDGRRFARHAPTALDRARQGLRWLVREPAGDVLGMAGMIEAWAAKLAGEPAPRLPAAVSAWMSVAVIDAFAESLERGGESVAVAPAPASFRRSFAGEGAAEKG